MRTVTMMMVTTILFEPWQTLFSKFDCVYDVCPPANAMAWLLDQSNGTVAASQFRHKPPSRYATGMLSLTAGKMHMIG
jgi:hypothetical protein